MYLQSSPSLLSCDRTQLLHPISQSVFGIAWEIIKTNLNSILTPQAPSLRVLYTTATSHSPKCILITWDNIILIPLEILKRHTTTTSHLLTGIRITRGIIKTKTSHSFIEGFDVIEGQSH
jgi:hypothetical protein